MGASPALLAFAAIALAGENAPAGVARKADRHAWVFVSQLGKHPVPGTVKFDIHKLRHSFLTPEKRLNLPQRQRLHNCKSRTGDNHARRKRGDHDRSQSDQDKFPAAGIFDRCLRAMIVNDDVL
jgi:hypothetical protein